MKISTIFAYLMICAIIGGVGNVSAMQSNDEKLSFEQQLNFLTAGLESEIRRMPADEQVWKLKLLLESVENKIYTILIKEAFDYNPDLRVLEQTARQKAAKIIKGICDKRIDELHEAIQADRRYSFGINQ